MIKLNGKRKRVYTFISGDETEYETVSNVISRVLKAIILEAETDFDDCTLVYPSSYSKKEQHAYEKIVKSAGFVGPKFCCEYKLIAAGYVNEFDIPENSNCSIIDLQPNRVGFCLFVSGSEFDILDYKFRVTTSDEQNRTSSM